MRRDEPDVLVGARKECPLVVGRGEARRSSPPRSPPSCARRAASSTSRTARSSPSRAEGTTFLLPDGTELEREIEEIDWDEETAEKGGYETFMLKEIHEQADAVAETIADRTLRDDGVDLDDAGALDEAILRGVKRIVVVACGTRYHAGLIGRYAIEEWARMPVEMDIASEYRYRNPVVGPGDLVIGITQSGETADTLAAMRIARERGATVLAITNIMGSQATRDADGVLFTRAGPRGLRSPRRRRSSARSPSMYLLGAAPRRAARHARRRRAARSSSPTSSACRTASASCSTASSRTSTAIAASLLGPGLLPLPRPPRRAAGRARGRAQAQGDLLHLDRRLRRRRDEARPDRAARRGHAGRRRRDRLAGARQGRLEHAGGPRARRARHRRSRPRAAPRSARTPTTVLTIPRTDWMLQPLLAVIPLQLLAYRDRPPARAERRPAAQPRQDRHRRVEPATA